MNSTSLRLTTLSLFTLAVATFATSAEAHIRLDAPAARFTYSGAGQKTGPCGTGTATGAITEVQAGSTLTVEWTETINHPGHYRISIDPDGGDDGLVDPASETDFYTNGNVLLDQIADKAGGAYSADVTIPGTNCDKCSLQLMQVMTDKLPWDGNDIYYWCADIRIVGGEDPTSTSASSTSASSSSASSTTASSASSGAGTGGAGEGGESGSGGEGGGASLESGDGGCSVSRAGDAEQRGLVLGLALVGALALARRRAR